MAWFLKKKLCNLLENTQKCIVMRSNHGESKNFSVSSENIWKAKTAEFLSCKNKVSFTYNIHTKVHINPVTLCIFKYLWKILLNYTKGKKENSKKWHQQKWFNLYENTQKCFNHGESKIIIIIAVIIRLK